MTSIFKLLSGNKTARQTTLLFFAQIFSMAIGFIPNMLLAKQMGPLQFGLYSFAISVLMYLSLFFEFGFFASGARLLAQNHDPKRERDLLSALIIIAVLIATSFSFVILGVSFRIDHFFNDKIGNILRMSSIVSFSFIMPFFVDQILKGSNHIKELAFYHAANKVLFLILLALVYYTADLTPLNALLCNCISILAASIYSLTRLNPSFRGIKLLMGEIQAENRRFGFKNYLGRIVGSGSFQLDRLLISYFIGASDVGLYSLALSMSNPINIFSSALSSSAFKGFANYTAISRKVLSANYASLIAASLGALSLGYLIIHYYLGAEYYGVFPLLVILALAVALLAAYQPYNAWMSANGLGQELLLLSTIFAILSFLANFLLIPFWGALGAALATLLSNLYFLVHSIIIYRKALKRVGISPYLKPSLNS